MRDPCIASFQLSIILILLASCQVFSTMSIFSRPLSTLSNFSRPLSTMSTLSRPLSSMSGNGSDECPTECACSMRLTQQVIREFLTSYMEGMGAKMLNATQTIISAASRSWQGVMFALQCHLHSGVHRNLSDLVADLRLPLKSLQVTCDENAGITMDIFDTSLIFIFSASGCILKPAPGTHNLVVPFSVHILYLERINSSTVAKFDLNGSYVMALVVRNSSLSIVPTQWISLPYLFYLRLDYNNIAAYNCELRTAERTFSINLDHNILADVPECVINSEARAYHISLRHNQLRDRAFHERSDLLQARRPNLLKVIDVSYNYLTVLQISRRYYGVEGLNFSHNYIKEIASNAFKHNRDVLWIDLSYNELEYISQAWLGRVLALKYLNLSYNRLKFFTFNAPASSSVLNLDLRHNMLTHPPFLDQEYISPWVAQIFAAENPFICDCHLFEFLTIFNSSPKQIWSVETPNFPKQNATHPFVDLSEFRCSLPSYLHGEKIADLSFKDACPVWKDCPTACRCKRVLAGKEHILVDCSLATGLTDLPSAVPIKEGTPLVLYLNGSEVKRLEHRSYINLVVELHAGGARVESVEASVLQAMSGVTILELHDNQLHSLPEITASVNLFKARNITLGGNPWACSCRDLWMPGWLASHEHVLWEPENIRCNRTGIPVDQLSPSDLNCDNELLNYLPLLISLCVVLGLVTVAASFLFKYRLEVLVFLYSRFRFRPFRQFQYQTTPAIFDVFISFSQQDVEWVSRLMSRLESSETPYRVCIHLRDFPVGIPIADNINWAVDNSRCSLLLLTQNFLASEWCRHEFRSAHARLLKDSSAKLLIVVLGKLNMQVWWLKFIMRGTRQRKLSLVLTSLFLHLLSPALAHAFELGTMMSLLRARSGSEPVCPSECMRNTRAANQVMQDYISSYLPDMGVHMRPTFEEDIHKVVKQMTGWLGNMDEIHCHLASGTHHNISDLLQASSLSLRALRVTCEAGAEVTWDVSTTSLFFSIFEASGCTLKAVPGSESLVVPINLWMIHLERVNPAVVHKLSFEMASQLFTLVVKNSSLDTLPAQWKSIFVPNLMYLGLGQNKIAAYGCEIQVKLLSSLNLDNNLLTDVPECLLDGSLYANHVSLRYNQVCNISNLVHESQEESSAEPFINFLDLSHNRLSALKKLRKFHSLQKVDVSYNRLVDITVDTFVLNKALQWIDLSNNRLEKIQGKTMNELQYLQHLNLSHNRLQVINLDQTFSKRTELKSLDLRHNMLAYPPLADINYVSQKPAFIYAADNPFLCDCNLNNFLHFLAKLNNSYPETWSWFGFWHTNELTETQPYVDSSELTCHRPQDLRGEKIISLTFEKSCPLLNNCPSGCRCYLLKEGSRYISVDCSLSTRLTELPLELPVMSEMPIRLYVNGSGVRRLDYRNYLYLLSELHAEGANLHSVAASAMQALQNVTVLSLHNNQLRSLPALTVNMTLTQAKNISLGGNPWACSCHDLWMTEWLSRHSDAVYAPDKVQCRWIGKPLDQLSQDDLSCGIFNYVPLVIVFTMVFGVTTIVASVLLKYRLEVLVFLFTRFRIRPFDMYCYERQHALFDVFVSFSQHNFRWVVEKLVDQLENRTKPYRLCIQMRDFPIGVPISDCIQWAAANSRCTLLVLTRDLLASEWSRQDFRSMHVRLLREPNIKVLIIILGPLDVRNLDPILRVYMRTHTYLRTDDKSFWAKLEYALPAPQPPCPLPVLGHVAEDGGQIDLDTFLPAMAAGDVSPKFMHIS